jgi:isochorismate synthase
VQRDPALETVDGDLLWELNEVFLVLPFEVDRQRIPYIRSDIELRFGEIDPDIEVLWTCQGSDAADPSLQPVTDRAEHERWVRAALGAITAGALDKVVLSRVVRVPLDAAQVIDLFLRNVSDRPDAFAAIMHAPGHGTWTGVSPERSVEEEDDIVGVDALAGTMPMETAPLDASAWGEKEHHEQRLVTDHVVRIMEEAGLIGVHVAATEVVQAGNLAHLRTRIQADLAGLPLSDLVLALHPTPAVGGAPTARALAFIRAHERHDRRLYGGVWGPWNPDGRTELFVNIRCLQQADRWADLFVGGGITAQSDPAAEWEETEAKARTLLLPIASVRGTLN